MTLQVGELIAYLGIDHTQFERSLVMAGAQLDRFAVRSKTALTGFERGADQAFRRFDANRAQLAKMARSTERFGRTLNRNVTVPIIAAAAASGKLALSFEQEMAKIVGLVGVNRRVVDGWGQDLLRLGPQLGKGPQELAEALFFVTSAGARGAQAIDILTESAKASAAGLGETKDVADAVTSAVNAYGAENLSAAQATDVLVATVREGKLEASELSGVLGRLMPLGNELGVSFDQVGAALAAMTRVNGDAAESATMLRGIMSTLIKPSAQARTQLEEYGLSAQGLREQLREQGLLSTLMTLSETFGDNEEAMGRVFPNVRALTGVLNVLGQDGDVVRGMFDRLADAAGDSQDAFDAMADTDVFKFKQAWAEIVAAATQAGEVVASAVLPMFEDLAGVVGELVDAFSELDPWQQKIVLSLVALAAAAGPAALLTAGMIRAFGGLVTTAAAVSTGIQAMVLRYREAAIFSTQMTAAAQASDKAIYALTPVVAGLTAALVLFTVAAAGAASEYADLNRELAKMRDTPADALDSTSERLQRIRDDVKGIDWRDFFGPDSEQRAKALRNEIKATAETSATAADELLRLALAEGELYRAADGRIRAQSAGVDETVLSAEEFKRLRGEVEAEAQAERDAERASRGHAGGMAGATDAAFALAGAQAEATDAASEAEAAIDAETDALEEFEGQIDSLVGRVIDLEEAQDGVVAAAYEVRDALKDNGTELDGNSKKALENREAVRGWADAVREHIQMMLEQGASVSEVDGALEGHIDRLRRVGERMGLTRDEVDDLVEHYGLVPEDIITAIRTTGAGAARAQTDAVKESTDRHAGAADSAAEANRRYQRELDETARQMGISRGELDQLIRKYDEVPSDVSTRLRTTGKNQAIRDAKDLREALGQVGETVASVSGTFKYTTEALIAKYQAMGGIEHIPGHHAAAGVARISAVPQRVWGEAGKEAYIPLGVGKQARGREVLAQAAAMLGGHVSFGDDGKPLYLAAGGVRLPHTFTMTPQLDFATKAMPAGAIIGGPGGAGLVAALKWIQSLGFHVAEHPLFGGVAPVHSTNSLHYAGRAGDINWRGAGSEYQKLAQLAAALRARLGGAIRELFWPAYDPVGGHSGHLHLGMAMGGLFPGGARLMDSGGGIPPGLSFIENRTGRTERVVSPREDQLDRQLARLTRRLEQFEQAIDARGDRERRKELVQAIRDLTAETKQRRRELRRSAADADTPREKRQARRERRQFEADAKEDRRDRRQALREHDRDQREQRRTERMQAAQRALEDAIDAERDYADAMRDHADQARQVVDDQVGDLNAMLDDLERAQQARVDAEDAHQQRVTDIQREHQERRAALAEQHEQRVSELLARRRDELTGWFDGQPTPGPGREVFQDLLDQLTGAGLSESSVDLMRSQGGAGDLVGGLEQQLAAMREWRAGLDALRGRGVDEAVIGAFNLDSSPAMLQTVRQLVDATDAELGRLSELVAARDAEVDARVAQEQRDRLGVIGEGLAEAHREYMDGLSEARGQFNTDMAAANAELADQLAGIQADIAAIGQDTGRSWSEAIAAGIASRVPAIRRQVDQVREALSDLAVAEKNLQRAGGRAADPSPDAAKYYSTIKAIFDQYGVSLAKGAGGESAGDRVARIANEVATGQRSLTDVKRSVKRLAGMAVGGIALADAGGVPALLAEAGRDEAVIPLPAGWEAAVGRMLTGQSSGAGSYAPVYHIDARGAAPGVEAEIRRVLDDVDREHYREYVAAGGAA